MACLLVAAAIGIGATGALAQESETTDSNILDSWLTEEESTNATDENGWFDLEVDTEAWKTRAGATSAVLGGQFDRMTASLGGLFSDDRSRANNETVAQAKREINENSDRYVRAIKNRSEPSMAYDTHRIIVSHEGSKNADLYLVGNVTTVNNSSTLESLTALNESEFDATYPNRSVDETWGVDGDFAEDLPTVANEIATRVADNDSLGKDYQAKLVGRYCGSTSFDDPGECDVRSTLWLSADDLDVEEWTPSDDDDDGFLPFVSVSAVGVVARAA